MKKYILLILVLLLLVNSALAQEDDEWQGDGDMEYHCETVSSLIDAIEGGDDLDDLADTSIARNDDDEFSVDAYVSAQVLALLQDDPDAEINLDDIFSDAVDACEEDSSSTRSTNGETFNVIVSGNANLRSCAGTNCSIAGQAAAGELLTVVGTEGDWYEVEFDDGTAFIASFLVTRGPDDVITTDDFYTDSRTGCVVAFDIKRGDADMNIIISGDRRDDVVVDLYRPNETTALRVEGQLDKTFIDTGDPYIHQYYRYNVGWPAGVYNLEIQLDNEISKLAWELEERGDYNVYVICDE